MHLLYESITTLPGLKIWDRQPQFSFTNSTTFRAGILEKVEAGEELKYYLDDYYARFLHHKAFLYCDAFLEFKESSDQEVYDDYLVNLKDYVKNDLTILENIRLCDINGHYTRVRAVDEDDMKMLCEVSGSTLTSKEVFIVNICHTKPNDFRIVGNEAFNITCDQYLNNRLIGVSLEEFHDML